MKVNILKTFEDFLKEPLFILRKTIVNLTGMEIEGADKSISVEITQDGYQINFINSPKAYSLLSSAMYKKKADELRQLINEDKKSEIYSKFTRAKVGTGV